MHHHPLSSLVWRRVCPSLLYTRRTSRVYIKHALVSRRPSTYIIILTRARPTRCVHIIHTLIFVCYLFSGKRQDGLGAGTEGEGKSEFLSFIFFLLRFFPLYVHTGYDRPSETDVVYGYLLWLRIDDCFLIPYLILRHRIANPCRNPPLVILRPWQETPHQLQPWSWVLIFKFKIRVNKILGTKTSSIKDSNRVFERFKSSSYRSP